VAAGGTGEKTEKATPKKRRDERKEGNVFYSKDVVSVVFVFGAFCSLRLLFPGIGASASSFMKLVIEMISSPTEASLGDLNMVAQYFLMTAVRCLIPILLICMALGILATAVQTKFLFSKKAMTPKFSRLSPIKGIKNMFSLKNAVELIKSVLKIIIMAVIMYLMLRKDIVTMVKLMDVDVKISIAHVLSKVFELILKLSAVFVFIAFFDWLYQRWEYERNIKMTKHEIKEEFKQTEGNPEIKGRIKDIQRKRARSRMMQAVPEADVIIRNPTHFAVALRYKIDHDSAPVVLAKGQDELALRIVDVGEQHGVTVIENKPLARAIYATTEINQEIPADYYSAVAEILVYVYKLNNKNGVS